MEASIAYRSAPCNVVIAHSNHYNMQECATRVGPQTMVTHYMTTKRQPVIVCTSVFAQLTAFLASVCVLQNGTKFGT